MDLREEDNSAPNRCHFFQLLLKYDSHQEVDRSVPLVCLQAELTVYQHRDKKWNLVSSQKSLGSLVGHCLPSADTAPTSNLIR